VKEKTDQPKRSQLMRAALELFAANGLAVPTAKIAAVAGVANGTLFNYFPNKQDLVDSLYLDIKNEIIDLFNESGAQRAANLRDASFLIWKSFVVWALANPLKQQVMNLLMNANALSPEALKQSESIFRPVRKQLEAGVKRGEFMSGLGIDSIQQMKGALITVCIADALARSLKGKALEAHIATGFEVYWRGVAR
jgi:AcrR family transcriptional regulator